MATHRTSLGTRLLLGVAAALVVLGGLSLSVGTEAGAGMARDLFGAAISLLVLLTAIRALYRGLRGTHRRNAEAMSVGEDRSRRLRRSPLYSHLPGNYWFNGLWGDGRYHDP
jgi:hypothetical protein